MPVYRVKLKDEAAWIAVLGSLTTIAGLLMADAGVDAALVAAVVGLIPTVGRLIIGALLPEPTNGT